jgi:ribonucleotide reductase beta subunit family protein with ferritin-like domain
MHSTASVSNATDQIDYADLYARWERGNWRATEIDLTQDRVDWRERMTDDQRAATLWLFSLFLHGEDAVAEQLSPYIAAAPKPEQRYFLTTQQADESRHAIFFARFLHEVAGVGDGTPAGTLAATSDQLTWGHRETFAALDEMADALRADPSPRRLAQGILLYHLVIEGAVAQPGQHVLEQALGRLDLLPGFQAGMREVSNDEQRHIAFGVKLLADLLRDDPDAVREAVGKTLVDVAPKSSTLAKPPRWEPDYVESLGFTVVDLYEESFRSLERGLRATGLALEELPSFGMDLAKTPRERAVELVAMMRANLVGGDGDPARPDPDAMRALFDQVRLAADPAKAPRGTTIAWDFADAEPWHVRLDDPDVHAAPGRPERADLTLSLSLQDFVDMTQQRVSGPRLLLTRRLRPRGSLRLLGRMDAIFGG